ncbi:uncharacterized protein BJ212DRAFT_1304393 [Suillus subaureus]|uniref:Uncharacterized protein n=1 Tax=Suillus subaureus TaxID=48587 RepID=A0A9P7DVN9_9AGAM|nr:uncharacterized protein BJ212DRAFT_1304393 [Suillus subaureus]KAG1804180.1 hypothetical protein BJ212DRAFT_1304393 [Suillus subaureus]
MGRWPPSSTVNTHGGKKPPVKQYQSEFNHYRASSEDLELQHTNKLHTVETRYIQQIKVAKTELKAEINGMKEQFEKKLASLLMSKNCNDAGDMAEAETNEGFEKDVKKLERSALAFGDNSLKCQDLQKNFWKACKLSGNLTIPLTAASDRLESTPPGPQAEVVIVIVIL